MRHYSAIVFITALLTFAMPRAATQAADDALRELKASIANISPSDLGARYGEALGAVEICIGAKVTAKAKALEGLFTGADLDAFRERSEKIHAAWLGVKRCANQDDPNQCKIIMDRSCAAAIKEIGPKGSALPGLIDPPPYYAHD